MKHPFEGLSVEKLMALAGGELGDDETAAKFAPATMHRNARPEDELLKFMAGLAQTPQGEAMFQWICRLTILAPYPVVIENKDALAYAAAKHQSRVAVGEVILSAIEAGNRLIDEAKEAKNAKPD